MGKLKRTRVEFTSLELDVLEDAATSHQYTLDEDYALRIQDPPDHIDNILESKERKETLRTATKKLTRARNRVSDYDE